MQARVSYGMYSAVAVVEELVPNLQGFSSVITVIIFTTSLVELRLRLCAKSENDHFISVHIMWLSLHFSFSLFSFDYVNRKSIS